MEPLIRVKTYRLVLLSAVSTLYFMTALEHAQASAFTFRATGTVLGQSATDPSVYDVVKGNFSEDITLNQQDANFSSIQFSSDVGNFYGTISAAVTGYQLDNTTVNVSFYAHENAAISTFGLQNTFLIDKRRDDTTPITSLAGAMPLTDIDNSFLRFTPGSERYVLAATDYSFTGSLSYADVSSVPLPASAPLFGAALMVLGGAVYARRRVSVLRSA